MPGTFKIRATLEPGVTEVAHTQPTNGLYTSDYFAKVQRNIHRRLSLLCCHLPAEEYDALVDKMARQQVRGEQKENYYRE